jgi:hypothetical protein
VAAVERFQYLYPHLRLRLRPRPHLKQIHGQLAKQVKDIILPQENVSQS